MRDGADAAVQVVRLAPNAFEVDRIVLIEEKLIVFGPVRVVGGFRDRGR